MALSYEPINGNTDITNTKTMLHEVIPLTGTIVSGTYGLWPNEDNIKNFTHGMFQSVYDYPYLSSSSNHIFDISIGYDESSPLSSSASTQNSKKMAIYNQFSQLLLGYNQDNGKVEVFESDLDITDDNRQMRECVFVSFSRLLTKDQIKKGTFTIQVGSASWADPMATLMTLGDVSASTDGTGVGQAVGGEYGVLYDTSKAPRFVGTNDNAFGVVFYQAGIVALTASLWDKAYAGDPGHQTGSGNTLSFASGASTATGSTVATGPARNVYEAFASSSISGTCDAFRHRIYNISYNNTTEINSTIYFCRMPVNKFNYSSNPTYTSGSKMVIKNIASDLPVTYVTTIGLYSSNNTLLATAKLSEPLRKDPTNEITLRVRLDY
jgi:hypothetical protein|tara:strand:+ start:2971 stop:4110 length:1140 start_codon:yes stop_codon:yes gene_type:complete